MAKAKLRDIRTFWHEVQTEMRKTTWPERPELVSSTIMVIVSVILLAAFIGLSDYVLFQVMKLLIPPG